MYGSGARITIVPAIPLHVIAPTVSIVVVAGTTLLPSVVLLFATTIRRAIATATLDCAWRSKVHCFNMMNLNPK